MARRRGRKGLPLTDALRRGLRTGIDVLLAAMGSGLILLLVNVFKDPDMTVEQFTVLNLALTPVLSSIKNSIEDRTGKALLVSKQRPEPDPTAPDETPATPVQPAEPTEPDPQPDPQPEPVEVVRPLGDPEVNPDFHFVPDGKVTEAVVLVQPVRRVRKAPARKAPVKRAPAPEVKPATPVRRARKTSG